MWSASGHAFLGIRQQAHFQGISSISQYYIANIKTTHSSALVENQHILHNDKIAFRVALRKSNGDLNLHTVC